MKGNKFDEDIFDFLCTYIISALKRQINLLHVIVPILIGHTHEKLFTTIESITR